MMHIKIMFAICKRGGYFKYLFFCCYKRKDGIMKRKGFTLIELLAVIVILAVISLITVPMITSVIEESKKKALVSSVQGLIESANLYAVENEGVYEFLFDAEHQGSTQNGEELEYKGKIEGEGKLYIDKEGNTSICISNDKYYAYKNYKIGRAHV